MLLAYRFSGGVSGLLATARLQLEADRVRLEVGSAARAPDSDAVAERLRLLANRHRASSAAKSSLPHDAPSNARAGRRRPARSASP